MLTAPHRPERNILETQFTPDSAIFRSEYGRLRLQAYDRGILRVTFTRSDAFPEASPFLIGRAPVPVRDTAQDDQYIDVSTASLRVRVSKSTGILEAFDAAGNPVFAEGGLRTLEAFNARIIDRARPAVTERIETADGVKTRVREAEKIDYKTLYRARLPLRFREEEAIFGLGQPEGGPANLRGRKLYQCQANKSIAVPFFVSTGGYGLLMDCGCPFIFDDSGAEGGPFLYLTAAEALDYYLIPGSCEDAVKGYHYLSGNPSLLPAWAFGYIQSQERYETADELISIAELYREKGIGLDCVVLDWCSWKDGHWGQKSLDEKRFPDPEAMMNKLHNLDTHLMISIWPNMNPRTDNNAEFRQKGGLLPGGELYDALDPAARALYWEQARRGLYQYGIDAWWCDSSEPWTSEWSREERPVMSDIFQETARTAADAIGADNGNAYPFYHARAMWEGQRSTGSGKRVLNLTRSAWLGQQRFGTVMWSGDISAKWETLKKQIAIGLDFCASGMPYWTQDIGGFFVKRGKAWYWDGDFEDGWNDPEYRELFVRWYEYAAFLPMFRGHGTDIRRELTNLQGEEFAAALRYNRARYQLLPYLYSLAGQIALEGGIMMKPLAFRDPDDARARETDDEFLLGDDLLICPVTDYRTRSRTVYLPRGHWYELHTGRLLSGGADYEAAAPLDTLPVFVRCGAVLPVADASVCARKALSKAPALWVFPGADGKLTLYSDAGDGYGYEKGEYTLKTYRWNDAARTLTDEKGNAVSYAVFDQPMR
ncbi:MAG: glycoside hydrolase family 31 protein [Clostridia bacterium]|nr:glycoside hydrolase family 31 protein [Clostridia bacterium]